MNFLEAYSTLEKLQEWKLMNQPVSSAQPAATAKAGPKKYQVTYYDDGVRKTFTVTANSTSEAEDIAWSIVDVDSLYVTELSEDLE